MKRAVVVLLSVLGVVALLVGGAAVWALRAPQFEPYEDPVSLQSRETNTVVLAALYDLGVEEAFVDAGEDALVVAYTVPERSNGSWNDTSLDLLQAAALGAAAGAVTDGTVEVEQHVAGERRTTWTVRAEDFHAYASGEMDEATFEAKIERA